MTAGSHAQRGLDLTKFRTYDWGPADELPVADPRLDRNPSFNDHLQGAVEKGLAARGFERSTSGPPDLSVHYHASITQRIDVNRFDRRYGYCYGEDCNVTVVEFETGTLVLDFVDTRTKRVVWRLWAGLDVKHLLDDPDTMANGINEAVSRMFDRLPAGEER